MTANEQILVNSPAVGHATENPVFKLSKQLLSATAWHARSHPPLTEAQARVVTDLERDGIAMTELSTFGLDDNVLRTLTNETDKLIHSGGYFQDGADPSQSRFRKDFWFKLLGHGVVHPAKPDIFSQISLHPSLLRTVNQYLRCYSWLMDYNVWLNLPTNAAAKSSQMWHRDHVIFGKDGTYSKKIRKLVKAFIYLHDVNEDNGALSYLPGSQKGGVLDTLEPPKAIVEDTRAARVSDEVMAKHVPQDRWITANGKAGTIVFFDASGYHKGGFVAEGKRVLFKLEYGNWLWLNPLYPKVLIDNLDKYNWGNLPELRWAASVRDLVPTR